jgi:hypothetical protein
LPQPTLSSLTEREAVRNFLITKVQQLEKRVLSATAKPPSRSPFLASVDRCRHPGGLTQLAVKTIDYNGKRLSSPGFSFAQVGQEAEVLADAQRRPADHEGAASAAQALEVHLLLREAG